MNTAATLAWLDGCISRAFSPACNPLRHLGALCVYFFWIALVTGVYLFVFYETSLAGAWTSVERLSHEQWYAGGLMRSLHRYASDAAVLALVAHLLREFLRRRFTGVRWFSWFTGVPLVWIVLWFGITGYWMVWDELAQYVAVSTARLFDALPVFTDPMSRNFLDNASVSDRLFTLIAFVHLVGLPIFLVLGIWFHLLRIRLPRINPPRTLMAGSLIALTALSLLQPVTSHAPADLDRVPSGLQPDWFYLALYPLQGAVGEIATWLVLAGATLLMCALPWLWPASPVPAAQVHLPDCTGCGYCAEDCPYGAIDMVARSDGRSLELQAQVDPSLCVGCGICLGSCPSSSPFRRQDPLLSGIELPAPTLAAIRETVVAPPAGGRARVLLVSCPHGAGAAVAGDEALVRLELPCAGMLPPSVIDHALRNGGFDGVLLAGCSPGDCWHRHGERWTLERLGRRRPPMLRERVPRVRIAQCWNRPGETAEVRRELAAFRQRLARCRHTEVEPA